MKTRDTHPQVQSTAVHRAGAPSVALLAGASLALVWALGHLLGVGQAVLVAMSIAVVMLGLVAVAVRSRRARRGHGPEHDTASPARGTAQDGATAAHVDDRGATALDDLGSPLIGKRWSLDVFRAIDSRRFAAVCETWFAWAGFDTRSDTHRTDEGVDIWLHAPKVPGPVAIVRCRHWPDRPVGLQDMKEFLGLVARHHSAHGTYTTTSTYTPEALQFAREHGIDAVDGRGLLRKIQTRTRQRQQALLAVAFSAET